MDLRALRILCAYWDLGPHKGIDIRWHISGGTTMGIPKILSVQMTIFDRTNTQMSVGFFIDD